MKVRRALGDLVVLELLEHAKATEGGIILPDQVGSNIRVGEIKFIGNGEEVQKLHLEVGQHVMADVGGYRGSKHFTEVPGHSGWIVVTASSLLLDILPDFS